MAWGADGTLGVFTELADTTFAHITGTYNGQIDDGAGVVHVVRMIKGLGCSINPLIARESYGCFPYFLFRPSNSSTTYLLSFVSPRLIHQIHILERYYSIVYSFQRALSIRHIRLAH